MHKPLVFNSREALFSELAEQCGEAISHAIKQNGQAHIVVPGGSTPAPLFEKLSLQNLAWEKVSIVPSDERWISVNEANSNECLLNRSFRINHAKAATLVSLKCDAETPQKGWKTIENRLQHIAKQWDLVVLGMGEDGHFASLFPTAQQLEQGLSLNHNQHCIAIDATESEHAGMYPLRMSLTLSSIVNSKKIIVLITGEKKLQIIREVLEQQAGSQYPIAALLNQKQTPVEIYWAE